MSIDRRRTQDAELLENHRVGNEELLERVFRIPAKRNERLAYRAAFLQDFLGAVARLTVPGRRADGSQVAHKRTHVSGNGHFVVVENDNNGQLQLSDGVQCLESHATRE